MIKYFINGWDVETGSPDDGRVVTDATTVSGHRPDSEDYGFRLPNRRGKTPVVGQRPGPQQFVLQIACSGRSCDGVDGPARARALAAEVHAHLPEGRLVELRRWGPGIDRMAAVETLAATSVEAPTAYARHRLLLTIPVTLPGGVWLDSTETTAEVPAGTSTITALTGGSADMETVWTVTGSGSTTRVEIIDQATGGWWRFAGDVDPGVQVTIDPLAFTAVDSFGADRSALLTVGSVPFYLSSGAVVVQDRNLSQPTMIRARRAWYE